MNDLTTVLLSTHSALDVEEYVKNSTSLLFDNGRTQRVSGGSIQAIKIQLSYNFLTVAQFETLRTAHESNHSNTFLLNFGDNIDKRGLTMTGNARVFVFSGFEFIEVARSKGFFSGKIELTTSLLFNFTEYTERYLNTSTYTKATSLDNSFNELIASPYQVTYSYATNNIMNQIGKSVTTQRDKGGTRRKWTLSYFLEEADFLELLTYYRKKGGIMGKFGYLENHESTNIACHFVNDSLSYVKDVNGLYMCDVSIIEDKN